MNEHAPANSGAPAKLPEVIRFNKVTKTFGEAPHAKVAIQDVSFVVHDVPDAGELIAVACDQLWRLGGRLLFPYANRK